MPTVIKADLYMAASVVVGLLGMIGIHWQTNVVADDLQVVASALAVIIPAILAAVREIHAIGKPTAPPAVAAPAPAPAAPAPGL